MYSFVNMKYCQSVNPPPECKYAVYMAKKLYEIGLGGFGKHRKWDLHGETWRGVTKHMGFKNSQVKMNFNNILPFLFTYYMLLP